MIVPNSGFPSASSARYRFSRETPASRDRAEQYGEKRDQMLIAAGKNLIQLKEETTHGQFTKLVRTHVDVSVRRVQQLIGYANSDDPAEAIRKDRQETAKRVAKIRANRKSAVRTSHSQAASANGKSQQVSAVEPRIKGKLKVPSLSANARLHVAFQGPRIFRKKYKASACSTYSGLRNGVWANTNGKRKR